MARFFFFFITCPWWLKDESLTLFHGGGGSQNNNNNKPEVKKAMFQLKTQEKERVGCPTLLSVKIIKQVS